MQPATAAPCGSHTAAGAPHAALPPLPPAAHSCAPACPQTPHLGGGARRVVWQHEGGVQQQHGQRALQAQQRVVAVPVQAPQRVQVQHVAGGHRNCAQQRRVPVGVGRAWGGGRGAAGEVDFSWPQRAEPAAAGRRNIAACSIPPHLTSRVPSSCSCSLSCDGSAASLPPPPLPPPPPAAARTTTAAPLLLLRCWAPRRPGRLSRLPLSPPPEASRLCEQPVAARRRHGLVDLGPGKAVHAVATAAGGRVNRASAIVVWKAPGVALRPPAAAQQTLCTPSRSPKLQHGRNRRGLVAPPTLRHPAAARMATTTGGVPQAAALLLLSRASPTGWTSLCSPQAFDLFRCTPARVCRPVHTRCSGRGQWRMASSGGVTR